MDIWDYARRVTADLASGLARLETKLDSGAAGRWPTGRLEAELAKAWHMVIGRAQGNGVDLSSGFLSDLHRAIAAPLGVRTAGEFSNGTFPGSWTYFADALTDLLSEDVPLSEHAAWIVSQIRWGGHIRGLELSAGWLLVNGLRLQDGQFAIYPSQELDGKFIEYLRDAGPDTYDAENLRTLFGKGYIAGQAPTATG